MLFERPPYQECNSLINTISQKNIILCVGRVRKSKGQVVLLDAAKVLKDNKDWALVVVGKVDKPIFLEELKAITNKHSIDNQVYFIDETSDIITYYQAAKIVISPSFSEGFSLVIAEAMSCGCSVIATKNVGIHSSLVSHNNNGYLFEAGNIAELENLILQLIKKEVPFLGDQAREEILRNWSAKKEANNLMELYK